MSRLVYPRQEIWKPTPFWQRWRNASGERIRLDSGARMNDTTCCCNEPVVCAFCDTTGPYALSVTIAGVADDVTADCNQYQDCSVFNGTYILDTFIEVPFTRCEWYYDPDPYPPYCENDGAGGTPVVDFDFRRIYAQYNGTTLSVFLRNNTAPEFGFSAAVSSDCHSWSGLSLTGPGSTYCDVSGSTCSVTAL